MLQRHPGAAVEVLTPHQIASILFGTHGHEAQALDLEGCDVILDEVHVYGGRMQMMVFELVGALVRLGCRVHIGSATLPTALAEKLRERLGSTHEVRLGPEALASFDRHRVFKAPDAEAAWAQLRRWLRRGRRVLWVSNRVAEAQARYREAETRLPGVRRLLVHSRFRRSDRGALEQEIERIGKEGQEACVAFTTQVVEVSLDISFDAMITDAAPLDALVQRFGRVNRLRRAEPVLKPVWVLPPPADDADCLPYEAAVVRAGYEALPHAEPLREADVQRLLDRVYPECRLDEALRQHMVRQGDAFTLHELCHVKRSVFFDALDIDAYALICAADREAYAHWRSRDGVEIPVGRRVLMPLLGKQPLPQIAEGAYPFVVPDDWYDGALGFVGPAAGDAAPEPERPSGVFL